MATISDTLNFWADQLTFSLDERGEIRTMIDNGEYIEVVNRLRQFQRLNGMPGPFYPVYIHSLNSLFLQHDIPILLTEGEFKFAFNLFDMTKRKPPLFQSGFN